MNQLIPARSGRKAFSGRRLALLASAAGLAIAVVATGTSGFSTQNFPGAIATAHADTMQRSRGFADIVEKVGQPSSRSEEQRSAQLKYFYILWKGGTLRVSV